LSKKKRKRGGGRGVMGDLGKGGLGFVRRACEVVGKKSWS